MVFRVDVSVVQQSGNAPPGAPPGPLRVALAYPAPDEVLLVAYLLTVNDQALLVARGLPARSWTPGVTVAM
jgi:hypothetical protein